MCAEKKETTRPIPSHPRNDQVLRTRTSPKSSTKHTRTHSTTPVTPRSESFVLGRGGGGDEIIFARPERAHVYEKEKRTKKEWGGGEMKKLINLAARGGVDTRRSRPSFL